VRDRIQISTVCLFFCTLCYFAFAWRLYEAGGTGQLFGTLVGGYALALYGALGILAIDLKRWAWQVCNAAFVLHLVASLFSVPQVLQRGWLGVVAFLFWAALGVLGLWANLRPASRAALMPALRSAA
jgi:hypothetical protein